MAGSKITWSVRNQSLQTRRHAFAVYTIIHRLVHTFIDDHLFRLFYNHLDLFTDVSPHHLLFYLKCLRL